MLPDLIPFNKGDKWGFCDWNKMLIIENKYDKVRPFSEGYAAVSLDKESNKWGFIDQKGNLVTRCIYDTASPFSNGYSMVSINNEFFLINTNGVRLFPKGKYLFEGLFSNGIGYVGKSIKKYHTDDCYSYDDYYYVEILFVDTQGNELENFRFTDVLYKPKEMIPFLKYEPILLFNNVMINLASSGRHEVSFSTLRNNGFSYFSEGLAVKRYDNGLFGYCNYNEELVIANIYSYATSFKNGRAVVGIKDRYYIIDTKGRILVEFPKGIMAGPFYNNGIASVGTYRDTYKEYLATNDEGHVYTRMKKRYKYGLINSTGELIIPMSYNRIVCVHGDIAIVEYIKDDSNGVMDVIEICIDINGNEYWED